MRSKGQKERSEFGLRMLAARQRAGLTQTQTATRLGIGQSTVVDAETGAAGVPWVVQAAELYNVSPMWLATGRGSIENPYPSMEWPFPRVSQARWAECDQEDRGYVQAAINRALDECEAARRKPALRA